MKKLEVGALLADREAVRAILASIAERDPVGRISFESRLREIEEQLAKLVAVHETAGSVALMFGGGPVYGSRSIDAEFTSAALKTFQDLVTKRVASEELGPLGARGRIPRHSTANLSITELVRGSVGFLLEESAAQQELADTAVKKAINEIAEVITSIASENHDDFEQAVERLDDRLLVSLREFFKTLDDSHATVRIVEDQRDATLDSLAVHRARQRVEATQIAEEETDVVGELLGVLPDARRFEMRLIDSGEIIRGTVVPKFAEDWLPMIEQSDEAIVGRTWRTRMRIREVRERNRPRRRLYTLLGLLRKE
jgi:hypothetical protein